VTVKTFLGYLERDLESGDGARIGQDLHFMRGAADKMGRLLDELLEMSRVGRVVNAPLETSCADLVDEALGLVAGSLSARGVKPVLELPELVLFGDQPRLVEIWQNLLENACKFLGDQPEPCIEIGAREGGPATVFFVRDNGIGIEAAYLEKVFGIFEKLDQSAEGTGLGLALVRRIVELNGGKIWAESRGRGEGTCFNFTLPSAVRSGPQGVKRI
jgi:signal transduction histidine kinase